MPLFRMSVLWGKGNESVMTGGVALTPGVRVGYPYHNFNSVYT